MDRRDDVGPGQIEQVGVALDVAVVPGEPLPSEVLLGKTPTLEQDAPGAVEHDDALGEERVKAVSGVRGHRHRAYPSAPVMLCSAGAPG